MRVCAVGDIHGKRAMLDAMLEELRALPLEEEDRLLFLGDYIDRGEDSRGVIETLIQLKAERPDTLFLRGNHEQFMLEARAQEPPVADESGRFIIHSGGVTDWLQNGGVDTLESYDVTDFTRWWEFVPEAHWRFIEETEIERPMGPYHFVHAGLLPPGETWEGEGYGIDPRLWIREPFLSSRADFGGAEGGLRAHSPAHRAAAGPGKQDRAGYRRLRRRTAHLRHLRVRPLRHRRLSPALPPGSVHHGRSRLERTGQPISISALS